MNFFPLLSYIEVNSIQIRFHTFSSIPAIKVYHDEPIYDILSYGAMCDSISYMHAW